MQRRGTAQTAKATVRSVHLDDFNKVTYKLTTMKFSIGIEQANTPPKPQQKLVDH